MNTLQLKAILAGTLFGIYPLLLNRSKISGNLMAATLSLAVFMFITPFALGQVKTLAVTDWRMLIGAAAVSALGMMSMTSYLTASNQSSVAILITLMIVTQAAVTALYQVIMDRGISMVRLAGFACAAVAIVLLNKK